MKETEQGRLIPFEMSANRMRCRAQEYRRRGQAMEALALVRRAAEQEDTAGGWQALAAELRLMGCWEPAALLLARALSRREHAPSVWLDMARCQLALGCRALAVDCLYHLLQESPWTPEGDAARAMLARMDLPETIREPKRLKLLIHRGMQAWERGERQRGLRRLKRAVRLSEKRAGLMTTVAMLHMLIDEPGPALRWLARALRAPEDRALVLCALAAVHAQLDKNRLARAFLRMAAPECTEPPLEERFFTTAWAIDAWPEMEAWLEMRLKRWPYRTRLLAMKATLCCEQKRMDQAKLLWREILSIDPGDRMADMLQRFVQRYPVAAIPPPGILSRTVQLLQQRTVLEMEDLGSLLRPGTPERRVMDWCAGSGDPEEQRMTCVFAKEQPDRAAETDFLREMLTRTDVQEPMRQQALARLAEMKHFEPLTVLLGDRYTTAQCQPVTKPRSLWRTMLPVLLREFRMYDGLPEMIGFAADIWRAMPQADRVKAAGRENAMWCRAVEYLWHMRLGEEERARWLLLKPSLSPRRVQQMARRLAGFMKDEPAQPEKE